jgi:hypothetical protein
VALDRDSIVRRDFPTLRRGGYDPAAVEAHLESLASEVAALAAPSLSAQASEQVKAIVEAAERGAQEMRAGAQARADEHVARVAEAADRLRARIEQMETDVTGLVTDLRENAERLHADLAALQAGVGTLQEAAPETSEAPAAPPPDTSEAPAAPAPEARDAPPPSARDASVASRGDLAAARIVALDMALSGTPREDTDRYLAEHYEIEDRAALLDEVYAAAGA